MGGRFVKAITGTTNDAEHRNVRFECVVQAKAAMQLSAPNVNFGQVQHSSGEVSKTITLTRGDGGPIDPVVVSTGSDQIKAELREIEAGQKYELDVHAAPPWPRNMVRGNIALDTGVAESPRENIVVFGMVAPRLAARPNRFTVPATVSADLTLRTQLVWSDDRPGKALSATVNNQELQARIEDGPEGQQYVTLQVPKGFQAPTGVGNVVSVRTDDPEMPVLQISVFGMQQIAMPAGNAPRTPQTATPQAPLHNVPPAPAPPATPPQTQ